MQSQASHAEIWDLYRYAMHKFPATVVHLLSKRVEEGLVTSVYISKEGTIFLQMFTDEVNPHH